MRLLLALAFSACYLPAPRGYGAVRGSADCRAVAVEATWASCEALCRLVHEPPRPAEGFELDYADPHLDARVCAHAEEEHGPAGLTPIRAGACATGCTEMRATCLAACAKLDALPAYCERTCGAIYSRCAKRCARAARER